MQGSKPGALRRHRIRRGRALAALAAAGAGLALAPAAMAAPSATLTVDHPGFQTIADASTFTAGTIDVENTSTDGETISSITIDLADGPTLLPDLVFDPDGTAGDTVGKGLTLDSFTGTVALDGTPTYEKPSEGGFGALTVAFPDDANDFERRRDRLVLGRHRPHLDQGQPGQQAGRPDLRGRDLRRDGQRHLLERHHPHQRPEPGAGQPDRLGRRAHREHRRSADAGPRRRRERARRDREGRAAVRRDRPGRRQRRDRDRRGPPGRHRRPRRRHRPRALRVQHGREVHRGAVHHRPQRDGRGHGHAHRQLAARGPEQPGHLLHPDGDRHQHGHRLPDQRHDGRAGLGPDRAAARRRRRGRPPDDHRHDPG